jgi:hypothetical protein
MSAAAGKTTFHDLEPLICDADNILDVLVNLLDQVGFYSVDRKMTERDHELILFVVNVATEMTGKVRKAYYEAIGDY